MAALVAYIGGKLVCRTECGWAILLEIATPGGIPASKLKALPWRISSAVLRIPGQSQAQSAADAGICRFSKPDSRTPATMRNPCLVGAIPNMERIMYRLDQLITTFARKSIWLADAYFIGTASYIQALRSAAQSGVDVRLLMPGANDVPVMRALPPALACGLRVASRCAGFRMEWVDDACEDRRCGWEMGPRRIDKPELRQLVSELGTGCHCRGRSVCPADGGNVSGRPHTIDGDRSRCQTRAPCQRWRNNRKIDPRPNRTKSKAWQQNRRLASCRTGIALLARRSRIAGNWDRPEAVIMFWGAGHSGRFSTFIAGYWPRAVAYPACVFCVWLGVSLLIRAFKLRKTGKRKG